MIALRRRDLLLASTLGWTNFAQAADPFPVKNVKIVVPYPPGGSNDIVARALAQKLSEKSPFPFVIENISGAGGNVGAEAVANAEPDGHTLLLTAPPPLTINQALYKKINFDPAKSFAPVSLIAAVPIALAISTQLEVKSIKELIALAKAKPGSLTFGSSGNGSTNHLTGELFKSLAEIDIVHVPYKGAAPAMNDLISGHIHMMFDNLPAVLAQARNKRVHILAIASNQRTKALPDTPTIAESGVPGFDANSWFGLVAPARTPATSLNKLSNDIAAILSQPDVQARFEQIGAQPMGLAGPASGQFMAEERTEWSGIIRKSGAKVD
jgi:tripartite-type tricarboxylate transporter receptor subunit TctC